MIRSRIFSRLRLLVMCVLILNVIALIAGLTMEEELVFLHVPFVIGCLTSFIPIIYMNMTNVNCKVVSVYSLLKLIILILIIMNIMLALARVELAEYLYVALVPVFVAPDLSMFLNIKRVH